MQSTGRSTQQQDLASLNLFSLRFEDQSDSGLSRNLERSSNYNTLFSAGVRVTYCMMPVSSGIDQAAAAMTGNATSSPLRQLPGEPLMKNSVVGIVNLYA